nr:RtcB family protein [Gimesia panareensis]
MAQGDFTGPLERINDYCWRIPRRYKQGMRVEGRIYVSDALIDLVRHDQAPEQVANVAFLPGIQMASLAMPDIHWGYGFTIGGVCATDPEEGGVISPGGVGYDINCGVRLMRSNLFYEDVKPYLPALIEELFQQVPCGVGRTGKYHFSDQELCRMMEFGPAWFKERGLVTEHDIAHREHTAASLVRGQNWSASGHCCGARINAGHWDRAIISWKFRWWTRSLIRSRPA